MHDLIIIGLGPSGMTALLYATMYGLSVHAVGDVVGGKLPLAPFIIDYPGIQGIAGKDFVAGLLAQVQHAKCSYEEGVVTAVAQQAGDRPAFSITTNTGQSYTAGAILFATGNVKKQREDRVSPLVQQLGVDLQDRFFPCAADTTVGVPGVYASGDALCYPHSLEQIATAVETGITAAAHIFEYHKGTRPPILWGKAQVPRV